MINLEWNTTITHENREYNIYENYLLPVADTFNFRQGDKIPFIACFTGINHLRIDNTTVQFSRTVAIDVLLKIFASGCNIVKVNVRRCSYLVGKGLLMNSDREILAMICVTQEFYYNMDFYPTLQSEDIKKHFTLVVNPLFRDNPEYRGVYNKFKRLIDSAVCSVLSSWAPEAESFIIKRFPRFHTIEKRQDFIHELTGQVIENVLIRQVMN